MIAEVLKNRMAEYAPRNELEQENVLQETMHHYVLASLSKGDFFSKAMFHGGTCLRVFNGLSRFSEDLDFLLKTPDSDFIWSEYLQTVKDDCTREGIEFEAVDKSISKTAVKKAFLKTDSLGQWLYFDLPFARHQHRKIKIKLEVDVNPPIGSTFETAYLNFPRIAPVTVQSLASSFGTKLHALLCRNYVKGRDWYDFIWYISKKIKPNLPLLDYALAQQGPWVDHERHVDLEWVSKNLKKKIKTIDWNKAKQDVQRFLPLENQQQLDHWGVDLFSYQVEQLH